VRHGFGDSPIHCRKAASQIPQLFGKRRFQNALKNLLVAQLERLLNCLLRIERR